MESPFSRLTRFEEKIAKDRVEEEKPRRGYIEGSIKLNFQYKFKGGEVFSATEDNVGVAKIVILKDGQVVLDFKSLFNGDFITPTSAKILGEKPSKIGWWYGNSMTKNVSIGDIRQPKEIFSLLHEIGHTFQFNDQLEIGNIESSTRFSFGASRDKKLKTSYIAMLSKLERNAWDYAIRQARVIREKYGLDIFEVITDRSEFEKLVYGALLVKRGEVSDKLADDGLGNKGILRWKPTEKDIEDLKKLFDKGRLTT